jgi:hypothetical protein
MRIRSGLLAALLSLPAGGCCSLSRLFCGPDRSPWISERFDAPEHAVATLLEAIRRDAAEVVYLCLADSYRRRLGLDAMVARLAWQKVRDQNPGLHLAGYATVPAPRHRTETAASFTLDVEGTAIEVDVVQQSYWDVRYRRPDGSLGETGAAVASWVELGRVETVAAADTDRSRLVLQPLVFEHEGLDAVPIERIESACLARRWRVADLRVVRAD